MRQIIFAAIGALVVMLIAKQCGLMPKECRYYHNIRMEFCD